MQDAAAECLCARLCLLTKAAWTEDFPQPFDRPVVRRMYRLGALDGLVLRQTKEIDPKVMAKAKKLLSRSSEVYDLLRAYRAFGYRVMLPEDRNWPTDLLVLGARMPLFLFVRGETALFDTRRIAVAGSRKIQEDTWEYARRVGRRMAQEGVTMVCGGAKGVDEAAQSGVLDEGGRLILVPAMPIETFMYKVRFKRALDEGRLLILSTTPPDDPFSAYRALDRNHVIYALGAAALVLAARDGKGGSWHGATDCMKGKYTRVLVPADGRQRHPDNAGCEALHALGAERFSIDGGKPLTKQVFLP